MFYSRNVVSNTLLYERPADSMDAFSQSLAEMRTAQRRFAAAGVQARVAMLAAFADRLEAEKTKLARMICEEVGRCLRECEAEMDKSVSLIRY